MPPKRKAAAAKGAGGKKGKKAAAEAEDETPAVKDVVAALKKADQGRKHRARVDEHCPLSGSMVGEGEGWLAELGGGCGTGNVSIFMLPWKISACDELKWILIFLGIDAKSILTFYVLVFCFWKH